jgi:hypothetical protein
MKIVSRKQLMKTLEKKNVLYSDFEPDYFRGLMIASDFGGFDFLTADIVGCVDSNSSEDFGNKCDSMVSGNSEGINPEYFGREGMFKENALYAIYEEEDIKKIIESLEKLITR